MHRSATPIPSGRIVAKCDTTYEGIDRPGRFANDAFIRAINGRQRVINARAVNEAA